MTRSQYRLMLCGLCAAGAAVGPVIFLEERFHPGYLLGGLGAAFLCWGLLHMVVAAERRLRPGVQGVMGAGTALLSWVTISLVTVFDVIPHLLRYGLTRFDLVWFTAGFSPLVIPAAAVWEAFRYGKPLYEGVIRGLFRFSVPLFGLRIAAPVLHLPERYGWLFMFTGVMFLVLDGLGLGGAVACGRQRLPAK